MRIVTEAYLRTELGLESITTSERALLASAHRRAEGLVKKELGYNPVQAQHIEYYPRRDPAGGMGLRERDVMGLGHGVWQSRGGVARYESHIGIGRTLQLEHIPIRQVQNLYHDPGAYFGQANRSTFDSTFDLTFAGADPVTNTELTQGTDFYIDQEEDGLGRSGCLYHRGTWPIEPGSIAVRYIAGYAPSELVGNPDTDAVEADRARGYIANVGVDASPIADAVLLTVAQKLHLQYALRRNPQGFTGGNTYESERFQDYSYKRATGTAPNGINQLVGMATGLSSEALEYLEEFVHMGLQRL